MLPLNVLSVAEGASLSQDLEGCQLAQLQYMPEKEVRSFHWIRGRKERRRARKDDTKSKHRRKAHLLALGHDIHGSLVLIVEYCVFRTYLSRSKGRLVRLKVVSTYIMTRNCSPYCTLDVSRLVLSQCPGIDDISKISYVLLRDSPYLQQPFSPRTWNPISTLASTCAWTPGQCLCVCALLVRHDEQLCLFPKTVITPPPHSPAVPLSFCGEAEWQLESRPQSALTIKTRSISYK